MFGEVNLEMNLKTVVKTALFPVKQMLFIQTLKKTTVVLSVIREAKKLNRIFFTNNIQEPFNTPLL